MYDQTGKAMPTKHKLSTSPHDFDDLLSTFIGFQTWVTTLQSMCGATLLDGKFVRNKDQKNKRKTSHNYESMHAYNSSKLHSIKANTSIQAVGTGARVASMFFMIHILLFIDDRL